MSRHDLDVRYVCLGNARFTLRDFKATHAHILNEKSSDRPAIIAGNRSHQTTGRCQPGTRPTHCGFQQPPDRRAGNARICDSNGCATLPSGGTIELRLIAEARALCDSGGVLTAHTKFVCGRRLKIATAKPLRVPGRQDVTLLQLRANYLQGPR